VVARIAEVDVPRRSPVSATCATVTDPGNLPFANESFDVVVLFHALDLAAQPHQALREAARVLAEDGRLVVTGFNPWSLWGARRLFGRRRAPWNAHFINPVRMGDWLSLLDFEVAATEFTRYRPPVTGVRRLFDARAPRALRRVLRMPFGGVWVIKARRQPPRALTLPDAARARSVRVTAPAAAGAAASAARRPLTDSGKVVPFAGAHDRKR
jgi:SAM-dependent methyltransferase